MIRKKKTIKIKTYGPISDEKSVLDKIVTSFANDSEGEGFLSDCMSRDPELNRRVPLRYRIIAKGFVTGSTFEEVSEKLKASNCAELYSRSIWEAGLIYALSKGMKYDEWKEIQKICKLVRKEQEQMLSDSFFTARTVSLNEIRGYIDANSDIQDEDIKTRHLTRIIEHKLTEADEGHEEFRALLMDNIDSMSVVREKTRYYFCKYLYYYLLSCIDHYLSLRKNAENEDEALAEVAVFKGTTTLRRKKMTDEEVRDYLKSAGISFGEIFDAFNYFYFGYVSLDWMEILLEYYGNIDSIPDDERSELASSLRKYDSKKYKDLSDEEVLSLKQKELDLKEEALDKAYEPGSESKRYQEDRVGENTIRKYIKGALDIDRTTLICFMLFFGAGSNLPNDLEISIDRMNVILEECGFAKLRTKDEFDCFVMKYIETDEPVDCLMETVTDYALDEENFFIYRMYQASRSAEDDITRLT